MFFPDFKTAYEFGKQAEQLYEESYRKLFVKKGYTYHYDVRAMRPFRMIDVDFVESKVPLDLSTEIKQLDIVCNTGAHTDSKLKNADYYFVEVKNDSRTHETGNFVLELTAKDKAGWFGNTRADFVAYFLYDESKKEILDHCWIFNTYKVREYLGQHCKEINKRFNKKEEKVYDGMYLHYWTDKGVEDSNCLNILFGVDNMKNGLGNKLEYEKYK